MANPGRPSNINYRAVADTCQDLLAVGEKPGVRKVCERLGGSFSTISAFLNQWQEQQSLAKQQAGVELSEPFREAMLAEFGRVTAALKEKLTEQLRSAQGRLQEAEDVIGEYELQIAALTQTASEQQEAVRKSYLEFEKALSAANALVEDGVKRENSLHSQVNALRQDLHAAEVKTAIVETQYQEAQKQNQRLENELQTVKASGNSTAKEAS